MRMVRIFLQDTQNVNKKSHFYKLYKIYVAKNHQYITTYHQQITNWFSKMEDFQTITLS